MTRIYLTFLACLLCILTAQSQQILTEVGRTSSSFDYTDSEGEGMENQFPNAHLSFTLGYRGSITNHIHYSAGLAFNRYGTRSSNEILNARYSWDVEYIGLSVGLDGEFLKTGPFSLMVRAVAEPQIMTKGTQTINNELYDLRGVEQFDRPFLFLKGGLGLNYCLNESAVVTVRYMYGRGTPIGKSDDPETLNLISQTASIGLLWNLSSCNYCNGIGVNRKIK